MNGGDWRALLGREIRARRLELGWTQEDLADRLGLADQGTVSRWETGRVALGLPTLWAIEDALGLARGELQGRAGLV